MNNRSFPWVRVTSLAVSLMLAVGGWAQSPPSTGDFPLAVGEASILDKLPPPVRPAQPGQEYLRAVILPMSVPDGPVRILFEKPVDESLLAAIGEAMKAD